MPASDKLNQLESQEVQDDMLIISYQLEMLPGEQGINCQHLHRYLIISLRANKACLFNLTICQKLF